MSLALNVLLGVWLWNTQTVQNQRLARLEDLADNMQARAHSLAPRRPPSANRQDRIAFLLAAAGNVDESKRILAAIAPEEIVEIAHALVALPAASDRNEALDAALRYLATDNAAQAVGLLGGVEDSGLRTRLAHHIAVVWAGTDPESAARWLSDSGNQFFSPPEASRELAAVVSRWSAFAPDAAARFLDARPSDGDLQPTPNALALGQACLEWGRRDAAAALAWVQGLAATDPRQPFALAGVIRAWAEADPIGASGYVLRILETTPAAGGGNLAVVVVQAWSAKDPEAAARWTAELPDPAVRQLAMREVALRWAQSDPAGSARWASGLPADRGRAGVWIGLTERLADADPARVEAWLDRLPVGHDRDEATAIYINRLAPADPEKALTWTRTLSGVGFAAEQVRNILSQWELKDIGAARNWAAANGVALPVEAGSR